MNAKSQGGKSGLIKMLMQEHGISKRKAEKAVNAVFALMTRALRMGEAVEIPGGQIWVESWPAGRPKRKFQKFRNVQTKKLSSILVTYPSRMIRFRPDRELFEPPRPFTKTKSRRKPRPPKQPPGPAEKLNRLHQQLVGTDLCLEVLERLVGICNRDVNRLLACLKELRKRGRQYDNDRQLIAGVARLAGLGFGCERR